MGVPLYFDFIASNAFGMHFDLAKVTVHPPNPPPVMRDPSTPSTPKAISTNSSSSLHDTSKSSLDEDA